MIQSPVPMEPGTSLSEPMCNLHMRVPVQSRRQAKLAAVASGVPFRLYVAQLLLQAQPISQEHLDVLRSKGLGLSCGHRAPPVSQSAREICVDAVVSGVCGDNVETQNVIGDKKQCS